MYSLKVERLRLQPYYVHIHVFMVTFVMCVGKHPGSSDGMTEVELHLWALLITVMW